MLIPKNEKILPDKDENNCLKIHKLIKYVYSHTFPAHVRSLDASNLR